MYLAIVFNSPISMRSASVLDSHMYIHNPYTQFACWYAFGVFTPLAHTSFPRRSVHPRCARSTLPQYRRVRTRHRRCLYLTRLLVCAQHRGGWEWGRGEVIAWMQTCSVMLSGCKWRLQMHFGRFVCCVWSTWAMHTHIYTHFYTQMHTHTNTLSDTQAQIHIIMQVSNWRYQKFEVDIFALCGDMLRYDYVNTYIHILYVYIYNYIYIYIWKHIYMYISIYI